MTLTKLMRGALLCIVALLVFTNVSLAQTKTVTGKVTDSKGEAIPSATVTVKGTSNSTSTAADGSFSINVPSGSRTLVISSVGFDSKEVAVSDNMNITLETKNAALNEVVVIGYGTRKVKDATGSVASITAKDFNKGQISTPEQLFQGRTPGVTVTPSSGEPGAAATINIRGTSAIRGNQQPLYIVDGVPLDGGGTTGSSAGAEGATTPKNPLMFINPNDIESISILKDASSAAIYGARGANGVIIITTKSGKGSKGSWNFGVTTSISKTASRYDLLNKDEFLRGAYNMNVLQGTDPALAAQSVKALDFGSNVDWQDQIFRTAISQNYNLGWGFARNKMSLRLSGSYDNQQGIVKNSSLKRLTGRANFTKTFFTDKLKLEATANYSNLKNSYIANTNNAGYLGSLIGATIRFNPTYPIKDPTGLYFFPANGDRNPVAMLDYIDDKDNINRFLTNISLSYKIVEGLTFKTTFGYDFADGQRTSYTDPRLKNAGDNQTRVFGVSYGNGTEGNGRAAVANNVSKNFLIENLLTYNKVFNQKHDINAILGQSFQRTQIESDGTVYWGLNTPVAAASDVFVKETGNFKNNAALFVPDFSRAELNSYFGRINYTFDDRYLLTATVRADGSSRFGKNNRYGVFPAFGAKWKILNEKFAGSLSKVFGEFSIRANWGIIGSQDGLGAYSAQNLVQTFITSNPGVTPVTTGSITLNQGNDNLKWEEATTTSIALDWASANRRLSGTIEVYNTNRKNLIFFGPTPGGFSATSFYYQNLPGLVNNQGLEFTLNYQIVKSSKFNWDVSYNMTFMSNVVKDLPAGLSLLTGEVNGPGLTGAYAQKIENGSPLFSWYMQEFTGYNAEGKPTYVLNKSGTAPDLRLVGKSALPTFNAGLTNNFNIGRWNASLFINAVAGNYVYNNTANAHFLAGILKNGGNVTKDVITSGENPLSPGSPSTRYLEKGDFLRLANAVIGYDFKIKSKAIKSFNLNISGQNLLLITNYSGLDPEVNIDKQLNNLPTRGFDYASYPRPMTFNIGLNIGF
jgi:TonB-dependent starch-binding outer membrane protein SusC